eukprot:3566554-Pleurochrysis_carterae.AAC.1
MHAKYLYKLLFIALACKCDPGRESTSLLAHAGRRLGRCGRRLGRCGRRSGRWCRRLGRRGRRFRRWCRGARLRRRRSCSSAGTSGRRTGRPSEARVTLRVASGRT